MHLLKTDGDDNHYYLKGHPDFKVTIVNHNLAVIHNEMGAIELNKNQVNKLMFDFMELGEQMTNLKRNLK